uniref:Uncharacterized protein n=1 Tax=Anguilla anguilla TaxID=7936 RepID=A0A0E9VX10_ANGAN
MRKREGDTGVKREGGSRTGTEEYGGDTG